MKIIEKLKNITGDLIYSILGLVVMNGVIQFVLYPFLNRRLGAETFGVVLTMISLVAIVGSTFGTAANYSRMVSHARKRDTNGDYNIFLLFIVGASVIIAAVGIVWLGNEAKVHFLPYYGLMAATVFRYYADVEFRLTLNYKQFFIYYLLLSIGYLVGIFIFSITNSWACAMFIGEMLAVLYVVVKGHIFKAPFLKKSEYFRENIKSAMVLSGTDLIGAVILNADRLMLQSFVGGTAVTIFYAATLVGKMISLASVPLNGVLMGYLTRYDGKLKPRIFVTICLTSLGSGTILTGGCVAVSHIFLRIMYRDIFELVIPYLWVTNASQAFYFISNSLTVIMMRFTEEKYQLYINVLYFAVFILLSIPLTLKWELWGMAWTLLIANLVKSFVIIILGYFQLKKSEG